eukprot:scaffold8279_cov116-Isochrysis_galbana.AAC.6
MVAADSDGRSLEERSMPCCDGAANGLCATANGPLGGFTLLRLGRAFLCTRARARQMCEPNLSPRPSRISAAARLQTAH